jgi:putative transposase
MLPKYHVLFGFIFSSLIFLIFPSAGWLGFFIIFLSSFLIDVDHYIYYVWKKKDLSLKNSIVWFKSVSGKFQALSKKQKDSKERSKQKLKVARIHEKITNTRMDYLHKVSTEIVKNHDIICIEDLAVKNLMKNSNLSQSFLDVALGTFYSMLEYKSNWNDKIVSEIDRYFPSSKMCHVCNYIKDDLTLKDREWVCHKCGTKHDRDHNASINIENQGLIILSGSGIESDIKQKRVEALPLGESMKPDFN